MTAAYAAQDPGDMEALRNAIRARWALGTTLLARGQAQDALGELEAATLLTPILVNFEPSDENSQRLQRTVLAAYAQSLAMGGAFETGVELLRTQVSERQAYFNAAPTEAARARSYAVSLAMLGALYADNSRDSEACPHYADAAALLRALAQAGQLSQQDRDSALRMIRERQSRHCAADRAQSP